MGTFKLVPQQGQIFSFYPTWEICAFMPDIKLGSPIFFFPLNLWSIFKLLFLLFCARIKYL